MKTLVTVLVAVACALFAVGIYSGWHWRMPGAAEPAESRSMDTIAEEYVKLVLAVGQHDTDYVDAYYGPPEWKKAAESAKAGLETIAAGA